MVRCCVIRISRFVCLFVFVVVVVCLFVFVVVVVCLFLLLLLFVCLFLLLLLFVCLFLFCVFPFPTTGYTNTEWWLMDRMLQALVPLFFCFFFGFVVVVVVVCFLFSFSLISPRSASQLWTCPCCICVLTEVVDRTLVQS